MLKILTFQSAVVKILIVGLCVFGALASNAQSKIFLDVGEALARKSKLAVPMFNKPYAPNRNKPHAPGI